ncbi:MAG: hypothetical protein EXS43_01980 [Opitutus sp.]|nr:hypothetical protein [Opitutus sp.]
MLEAFAVIAVFFVTVVVYVAVWLQARDPAQNTPQHELARLQTREAWLWQRLEIARRENWGGEMRTAIANELGATSHRLVRAGGRVAQG